MQYNNCETTLTVTIIIIIDRRNSKKRKVKNIFKKDKGIRQNNKKVYVYFDGILNSEPDKNFKAFHLGLQFNFYSSV